jgi:hypothetical protein
MEPSDPTLEALVDAMTHALDHDADMAQGYVNKLRQLAVTLAHILDDAEGSAPTPALEQGMRQALAYLDAQAAGAELGYLEVLRRCLGAVEQELFRWASSVVRPVGFSGATPIPVGGGARQDHAVPATRRRRPAARLIALAFLYYDHAIPATRRRRVTV